MPHKQHAERAAANHQLAQKKHSGNNPQQRISAERDQHSANGASHATSRKDAQANETRAKTRLCGISSHGERDKRWLRKDVAKPKRPGTEQRRLPRARQRNNKKRRDGNEPRGLAHSNDAKRTVARPYAPGDGPANQTHDAVEHHDETRLR